MLCTRLLILLLLWIFKVINYRQFIRAQSLLIRSERRVLCAHTTKIKYFFSSSFLTTMIIILLYLLWRIIYKYIYSVYDLDVIISQWYYTSWAQLHSCYTPRSIYTDDESWRLGRLIENIYIADLSGKRTINHNVHFAVRDGTRILLLFIFASFCFNGYNIIIICRRFAYIIYIWARTIRICFSWYHSLPWSFVLIIPFCPCVYDMRLYLVTIFL